MGYPQKTFECNFTKISNQVHSKFKSVDSCQEVLKELGITTVISLVLSKSKQTLRRFSVKYLYAGTKIHDMLPKTCAKGCLQSTNSTFYKNYKNFGKRQVSFNLLCVVTVFIDCILITVISSMITNKYTDHQVALSYQPSW